MLPRPHRLRKDKDFQNVREHGRRAHGKHFVLSWAPNQLDVSRFGIIASKKVGNAAQRHHAARLLRESIRHQLGTIKPSHDFVLIARAGIDQLKQPAVGKELTSLLEKNNLIQ